MSSKGKIQIFSTPSKAFKVKEEESLYNLESKTTFEPQQSNPPTLMTEQSECSCPFFFTEQSEDTEDELIIRRIIHNRASNSLSLQHEMDQIVKAQQLKEENLHREKQRRKSELFKIFSSRKHNPQRRENKVKVKLNSNYRIEIIRNPKKLSSKLPIIIFK